MKKLFILLQRHKKSCVVLTAFLSGIGAALYSPFTPLVIAEVILRGLGGLAAGYFLARAAFPCLTERSLRYACWIALAFGASCAAGCELQVYGSFRLGALPMLAGVFCWLGIAALTFSLVLFVIHQGGSFLRRLQNNQKDVSPLMELRPMRFRFFLLILGLLLLCWLPVWLANFPGLGSHDIRSHLGQLFSRDYNTANSTLYTLIFQGILWLSHLFGGGGTLFLGLLCGFQMILLGSSLAYATAKLRQYGTPLVICLLVTAFFGLFPVFPLLAISTTKDVPFAALALLFATKLFLLCQHRDGEKLPPQSVAAFCFTGVLLALLRHNGTASLALLLVTFCLFARVRHQAEVQKRWKRRLVVLLSATVAAMTLGNLAVNSALNAKSSFVTKRDMVSLPCQQLVRAMKDMPEEGPLYQEAIQFFKLGNVVELYVPKLADQTKHFINVRDAQGNDSGWGGFFKVWIKAGFYHPKAYWEAFLELNRGLWFMHDTSHAQVYPDHYHLGYLLSGQNDLSSVSELGGAVQYHSFFPKLQTFLYDLTSRNTYLSIPVLRMFFSVGAQCWLSLLLFLAACYRRDKGMMLAMGWMLSLLALLFFAPGVLVRYVFPIFLGNSLGILGACRKRQSR